MDLLAWTEKRLTGALFEGVLRREHSWEFMLSIGELQVEHMWRLLRDGALVTTDREDGLTYGTGTAVDAEEQAARHLAGRRILGALIDPETADLRISVEGGVRLDVVTVAPVTLAWELNVTGEFLVAARRGRLDRPTWFLEHASEA